MNDVLETGLVDFKLAFFLLPSMFVDFFNINATNLGFEEQDFWMTSANLLKNVCFVKDTKKRNLITIGSQKVLRKHDLNLHQVFPGNSSIVSIP